MKKIALWVLFIMLSLKGYSQFNVSGTIVDSDTKDSLEYASIKLLNLDSVLVKGVMAESQGKFNLNQIPKGDYILSASYTGYEDSYSHVTVSENLNLGAILLKSNTIELKTVTIQANQVIQKVDRQLILPTAEQKKAANNGLTLLQNLQLPNLQINPITRSIEKLQGGQAALYLNGVTAKSIGSGKMKSHLSFRTGQLTGKKSVNRRKSWKMESIWH